VDINNKILAKLKELQQKEGELPQYLELYRQLLLIQIEANIPSRKPLLTKDEINAIIRKGTPLLKWDALSSSIDWTIFPQLFRKAATTISKYTERTPKGLNDVSFNLATLQEIAKAWYEGSPLSSQENTKGITEELLDATIHCAMKPFLTAQGNALIKLVDQEQWRRRICPVCGGKPDFAFLEKEKGARWLLCSRCDTEWLFQRLECPYCGTQNQNELAYFADDKELYRLYVCQQCHTYLKAIDLRRTDSEVLLPLERLLTVDMDRQGQEKGYKRG
jgi:FdhE protein